MPQSTVYVEHRDESPAAGARVALGFSGGVTDVCIADRYGVATIEHASTGSAAIFVNGSRYGSMYAPGNASVTL